MTNILSDIASIGVILAVVQVIKATNVVQSRWMPFVSMLVGLILGGVSYWITSEPRSVWEGFVAGLAASGAYDSGAATLKKAG